MKKEIPNWSKAHMERISETLQGFNCDEEMQTLDTEESSNLFIHRMDNIVKECVPTTKRRVNNKPIWCDKKTQATVRKNIDSTRKARKLAEKAVRQAKRKFERKVSKANKGTNNKPFNSCIRSKTKGRTSVGH